QVRAHNQRRTSRTWTRHSYPLTPVLYCGLCGGRMHGEASKKGSRVDLYYACNNARRNRSAVGPREASCPARFLAVHVIENGIREELSRCLPTDELHEAYRAELWEAVARRREPRRVTETRVPGAPGSWHAAAVSHSL